MDVCTLVCVQIRCWLVRKQSHNTRIEPLSQHHHQGTAADSQLNLRVHTVSDKGQGIETQSSGACSSRPCLHPQSHAAHHAHTCTPKEPQPSPTRTPGRPTPHTRPGFRHVFFHPGPPRHPAGRSPRQRALAAAARTPRRTASTRRLAWAPHHKHNAWILPGELHTPTAPVATGPHAHTHTHPTHTHTCASRAGELG
jgi:hypothetical protein